MTCYFLLHILYSCLCLRLPALSVSLSLNFFHQSLKLSLILISNPSCLSNGVLTNLSPSPSPAALLSHFVLRWIMTVTC